MKLYKRLLPLILTLSLLPMVNIEPIPVCAVGQDVIDLYGGDMVSEYVDNRINISDEIFYGKFENGEWIYPGYFDYERHPALSAIQEAARDGDYARAKEEALKYYRRQYTNYMQPRPAVPSTVDRLYVEIMKNNVQLNNNSNYGLYGILHFGATASQVELNMLEFIRSITNNPDKQVSFYLMGLKKDGTSVAIESKDAGKVNEPFMEITTKGVTEVLYPVDDAYISPAENRNTNYGKEDYLLVEESISSINSSTMADKNTKRSLIKFDLSSIDTSSAPTRVVLKLYGTNVGGGSGEVIAMGFPSNAWNEDTVLWYRSGGETQEHGVFSNYGLPSFSYISSLTTDYAKDLGLERFCSYRYGEELLRFAWATYYNRVYMSDPSSNEDIAWDFLRQWAGYLNQRGNQPRFAKTLDGSLRDITISLSMQWYINSVHMTPDLWSATLKYIWLEIDSNLVSMDGTGNWLTFQCLGIGSMLSVFKEFRNFDATLAHLQSLVAINAQEMLNDDGSSVEKATNYAANAINDLLNMNKYFMYAGMNVSALNPDVLESIRRSAIYALDIVMPGAANPMWGDSGSYTTNHLSMLENCGRKLNLPELLYIGTNGVSGTKPMAQAVRYLESGAHVMRTGWDKEKDIYLFTDNDGGTGNHTHMDDLSVILYAYGQYLLTDQSFYTYSGNSLNLSETQHHNTILIENQNQLRGASIGRSLLFETNSAYDNFTLSTAAYTNVQHTRNFLFIKPYYFIINDYLVPVSQGAKGKSNNYKQQWHMLPMANPTMDADYFAGQSNFLDSANIQVVQANLKDMSTPVLADAFFSFGNNTLYNSKKLQFEKNAVGTTLFDTVLYPEKRGEKADVFAQQLPLEDVHDNGVTAMSIHINSSEKYADAEYYLVHDETQRKERSFGTSRTDGRSAYVERGRDGRIAATFLQGVSMLKDTNRGITLFYSDEPVAEFAANFSTYQVALETTPDVDLTKLTLYADNPTKVTAVYNNGKSIPFKLAGRYIYFGANPILSDGNFENGMETSPKEPSNDNHASSARDVSNSNGADGANNSGGALGSGPVVPVMPSPSPESSDITETYMQEIETHWGRDELTEIVRTGILKGINEHTLDLDETTSRAAFTVLLLRALGIAPVEYSSAFGDVTESDWFAGYVQAAKDAGLGEGIGEGLFAPNGTITREQAAKLLMSAYIRLSAEEPLSVEGMSFTDEADISDWAVPYVQGVKEIGIMVGNDSGAFLPKNGLTRAEAAVTAYRLSKLLPK